MSIVENVKMVIT